MFAYVLYPFWECSMSLYKHYRFEIYLAGIWKTLFILLPFLAKCIQRSLWSLLTWCSLRRLLSDRTGPSACRWSTLARWFELVAALDSRDGADELDEEDCQHRHWLLLLSFVVVVVAAAVAALGGGDDGNSGSSTSGSGTSPAKRLLPWLMGPISVTKW